MVKPAEFVVPLEKIDKNDTPFVGGKGANLGEMIEAGFPVPTGFCITAHAYETFLKENSLDKKITHLLGTINFSDDDSLNQVCLHIRTIIRHGKIPDEITNAIFDSYSKLGHDPLVAIRSSATSEDSKAASFAGQNETFLNVGGEANLADKVRAAWASLFQPRSVYYRHDKKISQVNAQIALVVQKMVESEVSGVMFSVDPVTQDKGKIIIEAIYGLGEYIVQGKVTPDHYEVDKKTFEILVCQQVDQEVMYVKVGVENKEVKVPRNIYNKQKLKTHEIIALAKLSASLEKHYFFPQDSEWAKENGKLFLVQTRPITTLTDKIDETISEPVSSNTHKPVLMGEPASPGIGVGTVRLINTKKDLHLIKTGDVLVAKYTSPDYVPYMRKSRAIITEMGGRTSHAAIVSREFGIAAVVGVPNALTKLKNGQVVTVHGAKGEVYSGNISLGPVHVRAETHIRTATKLYVNLAEPDLAEEIARRNVDGVGLLRAEFMIAQIGTHPKKLIADGKGRLFTSTLSIGIEKIAKAFYPRPVIYRATDFKTNEYKSLIGGKHYEPEESNPMLGYRGAYRYITDPRVFELELEALKIVRDKKGLNNVNLMIPFVRTVNELVEVRKIVSKKIRRSHTFKLFMMAEIPSNILLIDDFINAGIDGISIGSNDLTMLTLGVDRDNQEVAHEFNEMDPAVLKGLEIIIRAGIKHRIPVSICGQAPSNYPSLVDHLVKWGVTSISVSPDAIDNTRRYIHRAEQEIIKK